MSDMKPLLASPAEMDKIQYPVLASPKLDGIRCLCIGGEPVSRKLKPIPNDHIRETLRMFRANGLDGELMVRGAGDFNAVQSAVMRQSGIPDFFYNVFDAFQDNAGTDISGATFRQRLAFARHRVDILKEAGAPVELVEHVPAHSESELLFLLEKWVSAGYEGAMVRSYTGRYKYGRSTARGGELLKIKKFFDDEGTLVEIIEKMHNDNPAEMDELGNTKRSSTKANLRPAGTAGAMALKWDGKEFRVGFGPGIDDSIQRDWWGRRDELIGLPVKFSYQELSKDGIPRFGKALGFRSPGDM